MATLKEFEDALREAGNTAALEVLGALRERDRANRTIRPARRITGRKMTPELAQEIVHLNQSTNMTQQEIAFQLGVNQGRVNEVLKRGKWLTQDTAAPEAENRRKALERARDGVGFTPRSAKASAAKGKPAKAAPAPAVQAQVERDEPAVEIEVIAAPVKSGRKAAAARKAPVIDVEPDVIEEPVAKAPVKAKASAKAPARKAQPVVEAEPVVSQAPAAEKPAAKKPAAPKSAAAKSAAAKPADKAARTVEAQPVAQPVVSAPKGKSQKDKDKDKEKGRKPGDATLQLPFDGL